MYKWKCPVCGKEHENFGIKEFAMSPKTTLFGNFRIKDIDGNIKIINRKINKPVCSEECKKKNEEQYFVEEYKGNKIYCANGRYMPYLECDYWYDTVEGVKNRIDNPHLVPATPSLMRGLSAAMSGEPSSIQPLNAIFMVEIGGVILAYFKETRQKSHQLQLVGSSQEDDSVIVVGKGNINFVGKQTGFQI